MDGLDYLVKRLKEIEVVIPGEFKLRSGANAKFYLDIKKAFGYPDIVSAACYLFKERMNEISCVVGRGMGGIPLAVALSGNYNIRASLLRNEAKEYGKGDTVFEGYVPNSRDNLILADDVFTTGSNLRSMIDIFKPTGARIAGALVLVRRGEGDVGIPVHHLLTVDDL